LARLLIQMLSIGDGAMTIPDYVAIGVLVVCLMVWAGTAQRATWRNLVRSASSRTRSPQ